MKILPFKKVWTKLKKNLTNKDLELFYDVVAIDKTVGRRIYPGCGKEDNPRFYHHWFAHGRCHWNVILPCFLLNNHQLEGIYKIMTNDEHSVIINTKTQEIYDPTYNFDPETTENHFLNGYEIFDLVRHSYMTLWKKQYDPFINFLIKCKEEDKKIGDTKNVPPTLID